MVKFGCRNFATSNEDIYTTTTSSDPGSGPTSYTEYETEKALYYYSRTLTATDCLSYFDMMNAVNKHSRHGQGDYYRSNTIKFKKERESFLEKKLERANKFVIKAKNIVLIRKTSKATKEPIRFKSWKGKR